MRSATLDRMRDSAMKTVSQNGNGLHAQPEAVVNRKADLEPSVAALAKVLGIPMPRHVGLGMWVIACTITPEQAICWLDQRNPQNRNEKPSHIDAIADDMRRGEWNLTHQGIGFDLSTGYLFDGQHRVAGVFRSDAPQQMMICIYDARLAKRDVDTGIIRRFTDQAKLTMDTDISSLEQGIIKSFTFGRNAHPKMSNAAMFKVWQERADAFSFLSDHFTSKMKGITRAPVLGAIARAYYHVDRNKLSRFCEVLKTSMASEDDPAEATIIALRLYCQSQRSSGASARFELYAKTQWAIDRYITGKVCSKAIAAGAEIYPIKNKECPT